MLINVKANTGLIIRKLQAYGITRLKRLFQIYGVRYVACLNFQEVL